MKQIENPMINYTTQDEIDAGFYDEEDIIKCSYCGKELHKALAKKGMHRSCFLIGKAEYEQGNV